MCKQGGNAKYENMLALTHLNMKASSSSSWLSWSKNTSARGNKDRSLVGARRRAWKSTRDYGVSRGFLADRRAWTAFELTTGGKSEEQFTKAAQSASCASLCRLVGGGGAYVCVCVWSPWGFVYAD